MCIYLYVLLWWFIQVLEKVPFVIPAFLGFIRAEVLTLEADSAVVSMQISVHDLIK